MLFRPMSNAFDANLDTFLDRYPALREQRPALEQALHCLSDAVESGGKILACGNGGSAADAEHIVGELMKSFAFHRPIPEADRARLDAMFGAEGSALANALEAPIPAVSLVSPLGLHTAIANDTGYEYGFAQQVYGLGREGDVLIALSTSGNSGNVLQACRAARLRNMAVLGLTGSRGGRLAELATVTIRAPSDETHIIQEYHLPIYHLLCYALEEHFFGQHGKR